MKTSIFRQSIIGLLCLLAHGTLNAQATLSPAEQEVWQMELKLVEFSNAGNIEGFLGLFQEDYLGWARNDPKPGTKGDLRKTLSVLLRDGRLAHAIVNREPLSVRLYGDVAIVFYRERDSRPDSSGKVVESFVRTIHTWKKTNEGWKLIGGMSTVEAATAEVAGRQLGRTSGSYSATVRMIAAGKANIEVVIRGVGPAVVLLPSVGGASQFDEIAPLLSAAGFQTIALSFRGAGRSTGPLEGLTLHDYAADVAAVIEALGVAPAHVLGRTGGNRVARCLATDRPELVKSVILIAAGGLVPGDPKAVAWLNAGPEAVPEPQRSAAFRSFTLSPATDPTRVSHIMTFFPSWPAAGKAFFAADAATPVAEWWAAGGHVPLLVIQGLDDIIAPPGNGRALREQFGDCVKLIEIPNAGHALLFEQPEKVAAEIVTFLKAHP